MPSLRVPSTTVQYSRHNVAWESILVSFCYKMRQMIWRASAFEPICWWRPSKQKKVIDKQKKRSLIGHTEMLATVSGFQGVHFNCYYKQFMRKQNQESFQINGNERKKSDLRQFIWKFYVKLLQET